MMTKEKWQEILSCEGVADILTDQHYNEDYSHEIHLTVKEIRQIASQLEPPVGKNLLTELRKHYLVDIDLETGEPKADMKTLMNLWEKVSDYLGIKAVGKI